MLVLVAAVGTAGAEMVPSAAQYGDGGAVAGRLKGYFDLRRVAAVLAQVP